MSKPIGTLELIRQLSEAAELDEARAMDLASHLNEDDGARHTWPGNMLFDFLVNVYEDGSMRDYELQALAHVIEGILIQADGMAAEAMASEPQPIDEDEAPDGALLLPDLSAVDDLGVNGRPGFPDVYYSDMQCDCLDWQTSRRKLAPNCPGRLCRHLAKHLCDDITLVPAHRLNLRKLIQWSGKAQRGLPPKPNWRVLDLGEESVIVAWGSGKTCSVFAQKSLNHFDLFSWDLAEEAWSQFNRPPQFFNERLKAFLAEVAEASESVAAA